jgi:hypothetical protein
MIRYFTNHKLLSILLASILCVTTTNFACNTQQWLKTIGQYLPVAIQVAQSVVSLLPLFGSGQPASDQQAVTQIGNEATKDFQLLQSLYQQYQAKPDAGTQAEIENVLNLVTTNLPAMLTAAHIKDQNLSQKIVAAVNILLSIADVIIAQMPVQSPALKARRARKAQLKLGAPLTPQSVKMQWDTVVCANNPNCTALVH